MEEVVHQLIESATVLVSKTIELIEMLTYGHSRATFHGIVERACRRHRSRRRVSFDAVKKVYGVQGHDMRAISG